MFTTDETVKAMKEALEGDPKELFSALAHISENHYLVHAFDASSIQVLDKGSVQDLQR